MTRKSIVIPNLFRNLEFPNDNQLIAFVLVSTCKLVLYKGVPKGLKIYNRLEVGEIFHPLV